MLSTLLYPPSRPDTERLRAAVGGKTVLLTGASFGIGEALAGKLAAAGARLLLVARSADKLAEVQTRLTAARKPNILPPTCAMRRNAKRLSVGRKKKAGRIFWC